MTNKFTTEFLKLPLEHRVFLTISIIAVITGVFFASSTLFDLNKSIAATEEAARPARVSIIKITAPNCTDCFDISGAIDEFKNQSIELTEEREVAFDSDEGRSFVTDLSIDRVPTYIVEGEAEREIIKSFVEANGEIRNSAFVYTKTKPIFIDPATGSERGRVASVIINEPMCSDCVDLSLFVGQLKSAGVSINDEKVFSSRSVEAASYIEKYDISILPTAILSEDAFLYDVIGQITMGTIESDGFFVLRQISPPYYDILAREVKGRVRLTYLVDGSCGDCYDAAQHKSILTGSFGVRVVSEERVDAGSARGRQLIAKYNITKAPTVIISPEVDVYLSLKSVWPQVGTIESDGSYIFRQIDVLTSAIYKDLTSGTIIRPTDPSANTGTDAQNESSQEDMSGHHG